MNLEFNTSDAVSVPLLLEGVIVGYVTIDGSNELSAKIVTPGTESYLKELLLTEQITGISLELDYVELPENHVPLEPEYGRLRLVK